MAAASACVAYGVLIERRWYRLVRHRLDILPADGPETLTMLHLSDLHFVRRDRKKSRFLAQLPKADITVVTGDFLAEPEAVETVVAAVGPNRGRLASWFVLGSNDYFVPAAVELPRVLPTRTEATLGAERAGATELIAPTGRRRLAGPHERATRRSIWTASRSSWWAWTTPTSDGRTTGSRPGPPPIASGSP